MQTSSMPQVQQIVRTYASPRAFHRDASEIYAHTHYTVSYTIGLAHRHLFLRALQACGLCLQPLVITYQSPTNPWRVSAAAN